VGAVQRQVHVVVLRTGRPQAEQAAAVGDGVLRAGEVDVSEPDRRRTCRLEDGDERGVGLPQHQRAPRFDDAGLLRGDVLASGTEVLDVVDPHVRHHCDLSVDHVGRVVPAAEPDLDHRRFHRDVSEPAEGGGSHELEPCRLVLEQRFQLGQGADDLGEGAVGDGLAVPGHALVHPFEVGTGERADRQALGLEQRGDDPRRRRLAVGTGHVQHGVLMLRVGHDAHQLADTLELERGLRRADRLAVHPPVEPRERLVVGDGVSPPGEEPPVPSRGRRRRD
jgi:hypothetical protein